MIDFKFLLPQGQDRDDPAGHPVQTATAPRGDRAGHAERGPGHPGGHPGEDQVHPVGGRNGQHLRGAGHQAGGEAHRDQDVGKDQKKMTGILKFSQISMRQGWGKVTHFRNQVPFQRELSF